MPRPTHFLLNGLKDCCEGKPNERNRVLLTISRKTLLASFETDPLSEASAKALCRMSALEEAHDAQGTLHLASRAGPSK